MCTTCGCGDSELVPVELHEKILAGNDRTARHNREHFEEAGVLALNLMGSPGAGKTAVLEATAKAAASKGWKLGAVSADLATDNDARRLENLRRKFDDFDVRAVIVSVAHASQHHVARRRISTPSW